MKNIDNILKVVSGTLRGAKKNEILAQLDNNIQNKEEFRKIKNAWALASSKKEMPEYQVENLYLDFKKRLASKRKTFRINTSGILKYAAVFLFAIGISSLVFFLQPSLLKYSKGEIQYTTAVAEKGQISKIILPDNTVVWLNSGTKITYNNNFAIDNRDIGLTGQALFDVTKNKKIPLNVVSENIKVKVLGTKFNVTAYPNDKSIIVALESGRVEMQNLNNKSIYTLTPGNVAEYDKSSEKVFLSGDYINKFTSWKEGILIFRDDSMSEVISRLERRYNINIEVHNPEIYKSVFTGTIKNETLEEIFKSIGFACSVDFKIIRGNANSSIKIILTNLN